MEPSATPEALVEPLFHAERVPPAPQVSRVVIGAPRGNRTLVRALVLEKNRVIPGFFVTPGHWFCQGFVSKCGQNVGTDSVQNFDFRAGANVVPLPVNERLTV